MPRTTPRRPAAELAPIATDVYARLVKPRLRPEDEHKFVAVDVATGHYEVDDDDYTAVMRLRARHPDAEIWLERAGHATALQIRSGR